jgi:site-specific DNA recombinase
MQVALYARVSTSQQEKTDTIESQLEALHAYVAAHDHTVLPEHIFLDNGVSGSRLDRPALDRLRDQARLGDFEAIIILSPDRLARSYPHQWLLLEEFKKEGCRIIFMENPFGDSPHGQLLAQMQGMIAEYERSQIADRTRRGRLHKARKTEFLPWAYRVYGYHYIPKQAGLPPRVEIDHEQAAVVRDMFRWLTQEQLTTRQIVKRLNALRVPTRTGQNSVWHAARVRGMLNNPIYTGQGYYNRTKSGVPRKERRRKFHPRTDNYAREPRPPEEWVPITAPAIISAETFAKAQEQLKQNQANACRAYQPASQRYLLRTLVRCGQCQLHMQAGHQLSVCKRYEYLYYCCAGKDPVTVGRVERCPSRRVRADRLDALVWSLVRELLQDPQVILQEYALWQHVQQGQQGQLQEQLDRIDTQRQHLERQLQRLIDAYQQEIITLHDLSTRREQITQRLKGFEQERHHLEQQRDTTIKWDRIADNIKQFRALLGRNLDRLSYEDRQAVVQLLVEKVVVYQDGAVEVHHVLPFEEHPVAVDQKKKGIPGKFYVLRLQHFHSPTLLVDTHDLARRQHSQIGHQDFRLFGAHVPPPFAQHHRDITYMTQGQARVICPKGSAPSARGLFGHPSALIIRMRHMRHEVFDRFLVHRFPGASNRKDKAPPAGRIGLVPLLHHAHVGLRAIGRIAADNDQPGPRGWDKFVHHLAKQRIFAAIPSMALGQNEPKAHRYAIPSPRRHQQHEAQAEKPWVMLADAAFLCHRIFRAAFVGVAAVAKEIQDAVRRCGQGGHKILRQPAHGQMDVPVGSFEQTPKAPRSDSGGCPPRHLFQGVAPRVHGLHEHQPAEDEAMPTAPYGGHAAKYQGHKRREVGKGHQHAQRHL